MFDKFHHPCSNRKFVLPLIFWTAWLPFSKIILVIIGFKPFTSFWHVNLQPRAKRFSSQFPCTRFKWPLVLNLIIRDCFKKGFETQPISLRCILILQTDFYNVLSKGGDSIWSFDMVIKERKSIFDQESFKLFTF